MRAQLARRRELLAAGDAPLGWKVGFGAPAAMTMLRIDAPLVGFLTAAGSLEPGATASLAGFVKPVAEPEIAVHMGTDLPGGGDLAAAAAAVGAIGPAIELADLDRPPEDVEAILTGNIYHRIRAARSARHRARRLQGRRRDRPRVPARRRGGAHLRSAGQYRQARRYRPARRRRARRVRRTAARRRGRSSPDRSWLRCSSSRTRTAWPMSSIRSAASRCTSPGVESFLSFFFRVQ